MKTGFVWACLGCLAVLMVGCQTSGGSVALKPADHVVFRFNSAGDWETGGNRGTYWQELDLGASTGASYRSGHIQGWDRSLTPKDTRQAFAKLIDAGLFDLSSDASAGMPARDETVAPQDQYVITGMVGGRTIDARFAAKNADSGARRNVVKAFNDLIQQWGGKQP